MPFLGTDYHYKPVSIDETPGRNFNYDILTAVLMAFTFLSVGLESLSGHGPVQRQKLKI